jgi:hypothetical protein
MYLFTTLILLRNQNGIFRGGYGDSSLYQCRAQSNLQLLCMDALLSQCRNIGNTLPSYGHITMLSRVGLQPGGSNCMVKSHDRRPRVQPQTFFRSPTPTTLTSIPQSNPDGILSRSGYYFDFVTKSEHTSPLAARLWRRTFHVFVTTLSCREPRGTSQNGFVNPTHLLRL